MTNTELIELVSRAMARDNSAMEQLYKLYYTDVFYICKKYNLNDADAADIAQDTFIQGFDKLNTLDNATKFPAWIQRIATNKCLDLLKHNKVLTIGSMYDENDEIIDIPDESKNTEDIVVDKDVQDILTGMMAKLPIEQRVTLFMFYYQEYSIKEIAETYGCSENTVKSRLNYAKKAMRVEAEKLEDKGIKLRVVSVLPFLYVLFKNERAAFACSIPDATAVVCEVMGHAVQGATMAGGAGNAVQGATWGNGVGNVGKEIAIGGAKGLMDKGIKAGIGKGLIGIISAAVLGVVGVVVAIIIATSGGDDKKDNDNIEGKVTVEQTTTDEKNEDVTDEDKKDDDKGGDSETLDGEITEKETTEKITEPETTTEYVEKLERVEIEGIDYVAKSVVTEDNSRADFFWDHTENDIVEWYKSKGYYELSDNPEVTIKGTYNFTKGIREYIIKNTKKNEETYRTEEFASIYTKTGSYNSAEPHCVQFRYEGELDKAVANVKEFLEFMGLGEYADELIHSKNRVTIKTEDNEGDYTIDPYYHYDDDAKIHILSMKIWYYTTYLPLESPNVANGMMYIDDFINLAAIYTESEFNAISIDSFKGDFHKYMLDEIDPNCLLSSHLLEAEYEYKYYPEKEEGGTLKFEYRTDFIQDEVTFDNNRFEISLSYGSLYIHLPVNAVFDHSVLKFEDMTEEDFVKTTEARYAVLKKIFPSADFTVDEILEATKKVAAGEKAPIEFESAGRKYTLNVCYDEVLVSTVVE